MSNIVFEYLKEDTTQNISLRVKLLDFTSKYSTLSEEALKTFYSNGNISLTGTEQLIGGTTGTGTGGTITGKDIILNKLTPQNFSPPLASTDPPEKVLTKFELEAFNLLYNDYVSRTGSISVRSKPEFLRSILPNDINSLRSYTFQCNIRLNTWFNEDGQLKSDWEEVSEKEDVYAAEVEASRDFSSLGPEESLAVIISKLYNETSYVNSELKFFAYIFGKASSLSADIPLSSNSDLAVSYSQKKAIASVFENSEIEKINVLNNGSLRHLNEALESTGILRILAYTNQISEFAKARLKDKDAVRASIAEYESILSIPLLRQFAATFNSIKQNPIAFSIVEWYFPGLITYFVSVLSLLSDFSSDGVGGGASDTVNDPNATLERMLRNFGVDPITDEPVLKWFFNNSTAQKVKDAITRQSLFRRNVAPESPDIFHLRIGAANFYVPPVSIDVNTMFKTGSLTGGAIRQSSSPKFNSGYKETSIRMRIFFPNYQEIWGVHLDPNTKISSDTDFSINFRSTDTNAEQKIDKFLSSLRGLVAAFKYSPILPIKNHYLNTIHGITGVALSGMTISTVPGFPFTLVADLELLNFNHKPFYPMISDFNQAVHWGKYRSYIGNAAGRLHSYVNETFLLKTSDKKDENQSNNVGKQAPLGIDDTTIVKSSAYENGVIKTNPIQEWADGRGITLYTPAETQTKIFLPDTSSFRSEQEKLITDLGQPFWEGVLKRIGIDINESAQNEYGRTLSEVINLSRSKSFDRGIRNTLKDIIPIITSGVNSSDLAQSVYNYMVNIFISDNRSLTQDQKEWLRKYEEPTEILDYVEKLEYKFFGETIEASLYAIKTTLNQKANSDTKTLLDSIVSRYGEAKREEITRSFNVLIYQSIFETGLLKDMLDASRARNGFYQFREWEVPMLRVDLDPDYVTINGVSVSMGNNFAKLQVQMMDEPTYQHIGGRDTAINISMTVRGEKELFKIRKVFEHVSNLARLEHATGVLGFLGIKNVITALAGVKYVLPLDYSVNTIPNYPHFYSVQLTLADFDIFQQKREQISSEQQRALVEEFGTKKNPFFRIKQFWNKTNTYPDLPLDVRDESNEIVGYLDPDFYFRSFQMFDDDVIFNYQKEVEKIKSADLLSAQERNSIRSIINDFLVNYYITIPNSFSDPRSKAAQRNSEVSAFARRALGTNVNYQVFKSLFDKYILEFIERNKSELTVTSDQASRLGTLLTDYINIELTNMEEGIGEDQVPWINQDYTGSARIGDILPNSEAALEEIRKAFTESSAEGEDIVSFDLDDIGNKFTINLFTLPIPAEEGVSYAVMNTAAGNYTGELKELDGKLRFYPTLNGSYIEIAENAESVNLRFRELFDGQSPDVGTVNPLTGVPNAKALSEYQKPYTENVRKHWEDMSIDTSYRDISGRMLRAFPTYMLWLIDEGGYFAGVKMFDNFYGLQSIIDFSVFSSEDVMGDTLVFRVSNLYSKLSTPESRTILNPNIDDYEEPRALTLTEGIQGIVDSTLNRARNILSGLRNSYIVDINNIRLKPGVRVHLRMGYGSNPNSLQTVFNGTITEVEAGEIVTVTAQSDAIELGAIVNTTNKKGDSGKIDGGIDTGLWMSEPRDLMVRLLSMGASRTKEAISWATRGVVFSENKFGIRHFGNMFYAPLSDSEAARSDILRSNVVNAYNAVGGVTSAGGKIGAVGGTVFNSDAFGIVGQLWANMSAKRDYEIFKRNIYPGNGTGLAQFLGGDLDDGWSSVASFVPEENYSDRVEGYLGRTTDYMWNRLMESSQNPANISANQVLDSLVSDNVLNSSNRGRAVSGLIPLGVAVPAVILGGPVIGTIGAGIGLLGILSSRGGQNIFRTMGVVSSNPDDDLPGYDEVSFRAQTYMRTVWDLFQVCARMLPNYIVAVRPFEDRSTVFYGKPHWLYTSGLVPVTTGYPGDRDVAIEEPDQELANLLQALSASSSQISDLTALVDSSELVKEFASSINLQLSEDSEYAPTKSLLGKVVAFNSEIARNYRNCKIPVSQGLVDIGFHLPVNTSQGQNSGVTEFPVSQQLPIHKQLANLPPRYRFPFFADFTEGDEYTLVESSNFWQKKNIDERWTGSGAENSRRYNLFDKDTKNNKIYEDLLLLEENYFSQNNITIKPNSDGGAELDILLPLTGLSQNFESTQVYRDRLDLSIRMPLPIRQDYLPSLRGASTTSLSIYSEWGSPETADDEQFYIAMRWPYNPESLNENEFKNKYFKDGTTLSGKAEDYKNRKVLVYNPSIKRAVVCRPAYFLWDSQEGQNKTEAIVSPDAAYHLGLLTASYDERDTIDRAIDGLTQGAGGWTKWVPGVSQVVGAFQGANSTNNVNSGFSKFPVRKECYFAFVSDDIPLGVVSPNVAPAKIFSSQSEGETIVGFGRFPESAALVRQEMMVTEETVPSSFANYRGEGSSQASMGTAFDPYLYFDSTTIYRVESSSQEIPFDSMMKFGGNPISIYEMDESTRGNYFNAVLDGSYDSLSAETLKDYLARESNAKGGRGEQRNVFAPVYNPLDKTSMEARAYYDENYSASIRVIAGNGRTLSQASEIWDQFRQGYHTYQSVKDIFRKMYFLDPDSTDEFPDVFKQILTTVDQQPPIAKFSATGGNALDEFSVLFGADWNQNSNNRTSFTEGNIEAIEFVRLNLIDEIKLEDEKTLLDFLNGTILRSLNSVRENLFQNRTVVETISNSIDNDQGRGSPISEKVTTPKQLFLLLVGIFRQRMWEDPYARAWLVLQPDKKKVGDQVDNRWSFRSVDKIFQAFIDPYSTYSKDQRKFKKLLASTAREGSSASNVVSHIAEATSDFIQKNIAPIMSGLADSLSSLMSIFKLNMLMTGYALNEAGRFGRQANILNKALNDSIYYSLGEPGSLLRAVDNPFTREYGEPVLEIREPFQRMHYLSSFSHILSNRIQENINGVATTVTAYSDGKYPVTVAMDKSVPAERQVEKTVETGIYYDNPMGSGITGILHPLMHPLETARGIAKNITGTPDELLAKRVALSHLKDSLKDIYGGELIIIGNADIRPHDLVYLADVYERMYGIFEVEQVVHHFTADLGFITSIVPNALVTVNDPARWFMSSWIQSWFSKQNMRNTVRRYLDTAISNNSTIGSGGSVDLDSIYESLQPEMVGSMMYTNGHSALIKDIVSLETATEMPGRSEPLINGLESSNAAATAFGTSVVAGGLFGALSASAVTIGAGSLALGLGAGGVIGAPIASLVWKGWQWIRDNVLDQHGCIIQYMTKNGQPMDAGLSYNQGMVVGSFHSKALLPGILGVRSEVRTQDGYSYVRTDDLLKSLGWRETEITSLVRYISYETALVHARTLQVSGLSPDRFDFERYFRVLAVLERTKDGDTIVARDILTNQQFDVRFSGIDTGELSNINGVIDIPEEGGEQRVGVTSITTPGGRARIFVNEALKGKPFIIKIYPSRDAVVEGYEEADYEPGSSSAGDEVYAKDSFNRVLGTIFCNVPKRQFDEDVLYVENIFRSAINSSGNVGSLVPLIRRLFGAGTSSNSIFYKRFIQIFEKVTLTQNDPLQYFTYIPDFANIQNNQGDPFYDLLLSDATIDGSDISSYRSEYANLFIALVKIKNLEFIYNKVSDWPTITWDDYYEDSTPASLNWELVINNLARVYVKDLQTESESARPS